MKFEVIEEKNNPLLKRKEIVARLDYEGGPTPKNEDLKKVIAENLGVELEKIEISKVLSEIGMPKGKAWIKVWEGKVPEKKKRVKEEKK